MKNTSRDYPNLFTPIKLGGVWFKNRIFASPTGWQDMTEDGILSASAADYYERKAAGGAASVTVGECIVDSDFGMGSRYHGRLDREYTRNSYALITTAVARAGAVCTAELAHSGMYANRWIDPPGTAYGPVAMLDTDGREIREMTEEMIERTVEKYAEAAAYAKRCGFGMVMVHAGHGWLLHQFLHPQLNTRRDKWGGADIENRARIVVAICDAIKKVNGAAYPIEVRISGSECYEGGYDIDEGIKIARQLDGRCDLIHVSAGSHEVEEVFTVTHPSIFLPDGANVRFAAEVKKHVKTAVATVGALAEPGLMEEIIASGKADIVELARGLIADPDIPLKARTGRTGEIRKCIRCLTCFSELIHTGQFYCAINPSLQPYDNAPVTKAPAAKRVLVAGGGIAGMQAALTCAERGHDVTICEKRDRLGGVLLCEENVGFKQLLRGYLTHQENELKKVGVRILTGTEATEAFAADLNVDVIISALGSRPVVPPVAGIDGANVLSAEEAYADSDKVGQRVVILGAGLVGIELAIHLNTLGREVVIVELADKVSDGGNFQHFKALATEIDRRGIRLILSAKAEEITSGHVRCSGKAGEFTLPADTAIYAVGMAPRYEEASALRYCAPEFYQIGDCVQPKNIMAATAAAYEAALQI